MPHSPPQTSQTQRLLGLAPASLPPIPLDVLLERNTPRIKHAWQPPTPLPRHAPAPVPVASVLWITIATCACCSRAQRQVAPYILAKYAANEHSFRYSRSSVEDIEHLPREVLEKEVRVPFCEACFRTN